MSNINKTCSCSSNGIMCSSCIAGRLKYNSMTELSKLPHQKMTAPCSKDTIGGSPESMAKGHMRGNGIGINAYGVQSSMPNPGAQFKDINCKRDPHHYEKVETVTQVAPWNPIAIAHEATYMNRIKALNEPPVETYRELELSSVPADNYEEYEPMIYTEEEPVSNPYLVCPNRIEGFSNKENNDYKWSIILCILITIYCFYYYYRNNW